MIRFNRCSECSGTGHISFRCTDCICPQCNGKGKVNCTNCKDGFIQCQKCGGTGLMGSQNILRQLKACPICNLRSEDRLKVASIHFLFKIVIVVIGYFIGTPIAYVFLGKENVGIAIFIGITFGIIASFYLSRRGARREYEIMQREDKSLGKVKCAICDGTTKKNCEKCNGKGHLPNCTICGGSGNGRKKCLVCNGTGKIEDREFTEWVSALNKLSRDRLIDQRKQRDSEIQRLQMDKMSKQSELSSLQAEYDHDKEFHKEYFIHGGWSPDNSGIHREISEIDQHIEGLKEEISVINNILNNR